MYFSHEMIFLVQVLITGQAVGVAGGGLWLSLQSSLLLYLPTVIRLCIMLFFSCNKHLNFHVRCICRGKITATEDTAQCGDRSVVHTLT